MIDNPIVSDKLGYIAEFFVFGRIFMNIQLSDHFTYGRLIRFVIPSVAMMIFTSIYGVVDGL